MKKGNIKMVCEKCEEEPEKDEKQSNANWSVFPTKCKCGGKIKFVLEDK